MLLDPETGRGLDLDYWNNDHLIQIKTVNLNQDWVLIEQRLKTMLH